MYYFWTALIILGYIALAIFAASALCRMLFKRNDHYIQSQPEAKVIPFPRDPDEEFVKIHHDV